MQCPVFAYVVRGGGVDRARGKLEACGVSHVRLRWRLLFKLAYQPRLRDFVAHHARPCGGCGVALVWRPSTPLPALPRASLSMLWPIIASSIARRIAVVLIADGCSASSLPHFFLLTPNYRDTAADCLLFWVVKELPRARSRGRLMKNQSSHG